MRWFVSLAQQSYGPFEENEVVDFIRQGKTDHVRGEAGGPWLHISQSPFAAFSIAPTVPPSDVSGPQLTGYTRPSSSKRPKIPPRKFAVVFGVFLGFAIAHGFGWLGVLSGLGLVGWSVYCWRQKRASLLSLAWPGPNSRSMTAVTATLGLAFAVLGASSIVGQISAKREQAKLAEATRVKAEESSRIQVQLRNRAINEMPTLTAAWRDRLHSANALSDKSDLDVAHEITAQVITDISLLVEQTGEPLLAELEHARAEATAQLALVNRKLDIQKKMSIIGQLVAEGKSSMAQRDWIVADTTFEKAAVIVSELSTTADLVPQDFRLTTKQAEIDRLRKSIANPVSLAKKKAEEDALYRTLCGDKPKRNGGDGEVFGLKGVIQQTAHDPDSIDVENCTEPVLTAKNCWQFKCDVRGKNAFGAKILQTGTYSYNKLNGFAQVR